MKLIIHKFENGHHSQEVITGDSPGMDAPDGWRISTLQVFPAVQELHVWLTPLPALPAGAVTP